MPRIADPWWTDRGVVVSARQVRRSKYNVSAVCACGHPREVHLLPVRPGVTAPGGCADMQCACQRYRHQYDSMAEAARGAELEIAERAGAIRNLERQVRLPLTVNGVHVADYVADFVYKLDNSGATVVEDVKGHRTREYLMKRRLMLAVWGIVIQEYEA